VIQAEKKYRQARQAVTAAESHLNRVKQQEARESQRAMARYGQWTEPTRLGERPAPPSGIWRSRAKSERQALTELNKARDAARTARVGGFPKGEFQPPSPFCGFGDGRGLLSSGWRQPRGGGFAVLIGLQKAWLVSEGHQPLESPLGPSMRCARGGRPVHRHCRRAGVSRSACTPWKSCSRGVSGRRSAAWRRAFSESRSAMSSMLPSPECASRRWPFGR